MACHRSQRLSRSIQISGGLAQALLRHFSLIWHGKRLFGLDLAGPGHADTGGRGLSSLWKLMPGLAGLSLRSKALVLTAFCSSPVNRTRLSVNVSAIRNSNSVHGSSRDNPPMRLAGDGCDQLEVLVVVQHS